MKKLLGLAVLTFFLLTSSGVFAAESVTFTNPSRITRDVYSFTITIVTASNGALTATNTPFNIDGYVFLVLTNPGATAPTADWDLDLLDADGIDIFTAALDDRHTSASEQAVPHLDGTDHYGPRFVAGVLTIDVTGNSVNSGNMVVTVFFTRP